MAVRSVRLNLRPLEQFLGNFTGQDYRPNSPMDQCLKQWGTRYLTGMGRRYDKASRSPGAPWRDLAPATKKARRGPRKTTGRRTKAAGRARKFSILKDLGLVRNGLNVGQPGNVYRRDQKAILVGYGGPRKHKKGVKGSKATIADIAMFHQTGEGNLPKREILVIPDLMIQRAMLKDLQRALDRIARSSGRL